MKIYVACCVILHVCVQKGVHVTLELAERCQAWRLPLFHGLQHKYSLFSSVTKGCRVGLRSKKDGQLMQKGWRIVTSCKRVADTLDLPCHCPRNYKHGKCEGVAAKESELYTPEFTRRACRIITQELDHASFVSEAQGQSVLPRQFGEGARCVCIAVSLPKRQQQCGKCLLQCSEFPMCHDQRGWGSGQGEGDEVRALEGIGLGGQAECVGHEGWLEGQGSGEQVRVNQVEPTETGAQLIGFSQEHIASVEELAQKMLSEKTFKHGGCEQLLDFLAIPPRSQHRGVLGSSPAQYLTLGAYSHGSQYGITNHTRELPHTARYFLAYLNRHDPTASCCSSLAVHVNSQCSRHRDVHNDEGYDNRIVGLGAYRGGQLWVEAIGL